MLACWREGRRRADIGMVERRKEEGWCRHGGEKEGGGLMLAWWREGRRRSDVDVEDRRTEKG